MIKHRIVLVSTLLALGLGILPLQAQTIGANQPKTPFSVQVSASGSGISGVYRANGPTKDGPYVGLYVDANAASTTTDSSRTTLGGWLGNRQLISPGLYLAYGMEAYNNSGRANNVAIENSVEFGPFVGVHNYLNENIYITVYTNPIYLSSEKVGATTSTFKWFKGGVGLGFQF
jgi:hypothetical protein